MVSAKLPDMIADQDLDTENPEDSGWLAISLALGIAVLTVIVGVGVSIGRSGLNTFTQATGFAQDAAEDIPTLEY